MATSIEPSLPRFADCFWDEQHYGVQVINQRLGNSKQTCEEIKKLYHVRSQMEGDYGDRLLKLSQLIVGQDEDGTLAESLSHIPSALETTARAHMDLAQQLQHHLHSPLDTFINEQKEQYTMKHHRVNNAIKAKEESQVSMLKAKEIYDNECSRLNEIYQYLKEYTASNDERTQAEADRDDCVKSVDLAEQDYRRSINIHNENIRAWMKEWEEACNIYQQLEEKRIRFVRSSLWAFANMMSSVYLVDDQCCERIRTALELTDVDKDIYAFVEKYGTGKGRPELAEFEDNVPLKSPVHTSNSDTQQDSIGIKALPSMPTSTHHEDKISSPFHSPKDQHQQEPQPQQSEAMAFAAQAIEHMIQDDAEKNKETPITLTEHKLAPQQLPFNHEHDLESKSPTTPEPIVSQSPNPPQPVILQSLVEPHRPSSVKSTESGRFRFKPVPNPAFARTSQPSSAPPTLDTKKKPCNDENDNDPQLAELISTAALVAAGTHQNTTDQPLVTKQDAVDLSDDESEGSSPKPTVRPPPKDEKWVISSIRRPQMVPVRSTNARVYDGTTTPRASMIRSSVMIDPQQPPEQQEPSPEANVSGKLNRPHPPLKIEIPHKNETKAAAKEAIAAGRAHAQNHSQQQTPPQQQQQQQQHFQNDTVGIRPPPWQQDEQRQPVPYRQPYDSYNQRYSQQQQPQQQPQSSQGGLQRYGSVSGPRIAPDTITAGLDSDGKTKNNKEFSRFVKGVLNKSNNDRPLSGDMSKSFDVTPTTSSAKKEKGRFSLGIFGHKKDKRGREPSSPPVLISGGIYNNNNKSNPTTIAPPNNNLVNNNNNPSHTTVKEPVESHSSIPPPPRQDEPRLTADGAVIMHYARAVWSFSATIPMEMSFSAGDRLAIVKKQADGWWEAELQGPNKTRGLVPGNYMETE